MHPAIAMLIGVLLGLLLGWLIWGPPIDADEGAFDEDEQ